MPVSSPETSWGGAQAVTSAKPSPRTTQKMILIEDLRILKSNSLRIGFDKYVLSSDCFSLFYQESKHIRYEWGRESNKLLRM